MTATSLYTNKAPARLRAHVFRRQRGGYDDRADTLAKSVSLLVEHEALQVEAEDLRQLVEDKVLGGGLVRA
eukprot:CAMPEP_0113904682 /NCGR_PEP_ID=MMETSP0780_2-20120614/23441_1 /TAXON_ID=652834 /ORGANISM="Palpitomonas bilix" /LENGTH=70 /DNA_ID=CAMNT_0000898425 /DNA_START=284 /DNA_END=493 /DNA_ORIENTATION=- /assembly_acc=CAM_ASM_000599